ncbi:RNA exonuclease 5-like isoform X2 [Pungitius pungitius]|uniref:RNA exonuclease 5-like isoform X2 n=1 Tax=Pungitius pungitius TaxID=134920 RepID=UPI002E0DB4E8
MNLEHASSVTSETSGELSSAAEACNRRKRKRVAPPEAPGGAKRSKGRSPSISVPPDSLQRAIGASELTALLHYAALGRAGGVRRPSWCRLRRQRRVTAVNVVIVEGLTQTHFYKHYLALRHLRTSYTTRLTFTPSLGDLASGIFSGEVLKTGAASLQRPLGGRLKALMTHPVITKFGTQRRGLTAYVLTEEEMIKRRYPVKGLPGFEGFVCTDCADRVTDSSPLYGMDCEMVHTERGYELARVSLVDSDGSCLLDDLVKPQNRILNYLTRFSGITKAMLRPITTSLRDVQVKLGKLLPSNAVLVGHSLESDLVALKLIHRHVMDTSLLYRRDFGQRFKLKVLAEVVLQRQIQTEDKTGHNPVEDAVAALELAQYFIKMGPSQVVERHREELWGYTTVDEPADCEPEAKPSLRFADVLQTLGRSVAYMGRRSDVPLDLSNQQWHNSDKALVASFRRRTGCPFLSVLKFSSLSDRPRPEPLADARALRDMCVAFAGPLPAGVSEREVRRLFGRCGAVRSVRLLSSPVTVHAEVEFELLEGAVLALKVLNGLHVHGQPIKVQRPVNASLLDLDLTLDALMRDGTNASRLYAARSRLSARANGAPRPDRLSEEAVRETFGRFGPVEGVVLAARHAHIQFQGPADREAALGSSEDLRKEKYLVCPSLTPPHLPSWVATTTTRSSGEEEDDAGGEERPPGHAGSQVKADRAADEDQEMDLLLGKLDRRLQKLLGSLPEGTLSVVVLPGGASAQGLCLMEVKQ